LSARGRSNHSALQTQLSSEDLDEAQLAASERVARFASCASSRRPSAPRIAVAPGVYRARVSYGGLATVSADEMEGEDHYRVELWPDLDVSAEPVVLHPHATA
jgi:hypothetical protein